MQMTVGERIFMTGGRPAGFDYLRLLLSVAVVLWHSVAVSYGQGVAREVVSGPFRPFIAIILPMFFALSGFLVAGSLIRCRSLLSFLGLRAIRIFPALIVEVMVSACLIGAFLTTLSPFHYFSNPEFHNYFWNVVGYIHLTLPGVFESNPLPRVVNGQLWTIPYELECYIALALLAVAGIVRWRAIVWLGLALLLGWELIHVIKAGTINLTPTVGAVSGRALVSSFLAGVAVYLYRDRIPWSSSLGATSAVSTLVLLGIPYGDIIAPLPAAYLTVWLGLMHPRKVALLKGADYSYGVFLYGFVIQQLLVVLLPWSRQWLVNFALTLPLAFGLAALSWHLVEKPALKLRGPLMAFEQWFLERLTALPLSFVPKIAIASHDVQRPVQLSEKS